MSCNLKLTFHIQHSRNIYTHTLGNVLYVYVYVHVWLCMKIEMVQMEIERKRVSEFKPLKSVLYSFLRINPWGKCYIHLKFLNVAAFPQDYMALAIQ